ncbi:hypothetical protein AbraIFM66950_005355 [Aspergillus brasiliensis]|nr:hypothetical protein AbraIFM66950_005355 [Aspergillus brasiliensis]
MAHHIQCEQALPDEFSVSTVILDLTRSEHKQFLLAGAEVPRVDQDWTTPPTSILFLSWGHPDNSYYERGWQAFEKQYVGTLIRAFKNIRAMFPTLKPIHGVIAMGMDMRLYREKMASGDAAADEEVAVEQFMFNGRSVFHDYNDTEVVKQWISSVPLDFEPNSSIERDIKELYGWDPITIEMLDMCWLGSDEAA